MPIRHQIRNGGAEEAAPVLSDREERIRKVKKALAIALPVLVLLAWGFWWVGVQEARSAALEEAEQKSQQAGNLLSATDRALVKLLREGKQERKLYDSAALAEAVGARRKEMDGLLAEGREIDASLNAMSGTEQPQDVVDNCEAKLNRLQEINDALPLCLTEAQEGYALHTARWVEDAGAFDAQARRVKAMQKQSGSIAAYASKLKAESEDYESKGYDEAANVLLPWAKRGEGEQRRFNQYLAGMAKAHKQVREVREGLMKEDGSVDEAAPEVAAALAAIEGMKRDAATQFNTDPGRLPLVGVKLDPENIKPDLHISATGDLSKSLAEPLVRCWLAHAFGGAVNVSSDVVSGGVLLTAEGKDVAGGTEPGRLRVRVSSAEGALFNLLNAQGVDLLLTGRRMAPAQEQKWRESLPGSPARIDRDRRARVAYDALVFFRRGIAGAEASVSADSLKELSIVFSPDNAARNEAVTVRGITPKTADISVEGKHSIVQLMERYPGKICVGAYHSDTAHNDEGVLGTQAGSEELRKAVPAEYQGLNSSCRPTDATLSTGDYLFSYSIELYRMADNALASAFMQFASDSANGSPAQKEVKAHGFAPISMDVGSDMRRNMLTESDLPLKKALAAFRHAEEFGYVQGAPWVYGVRLNCTLHFEKGESGRESGLNLDAESAYSLGKVQEIIRGQAAIGKVAVVLVGHADPSYQGKLSAGMPSFNYNLRLSLSRAESMAARHFAGAGQVAAECVSIGCSWSKAMGVIDLRGSEEEQQTELAKCRRVEIFLIFPKDAS